EAGSCCAPTRSSSPHGPGHTCSWSSTRCGLPSTASLATSGTDRTFITILATRSITDVESSVIDVDGHLTGDVERTIHQRRQWSLGRIFVLLHSFNWNADACRVHALIELPPPEGGVVATTAAERQGRRSKDREVAAGRLPLLTDMTMA